MHIPLAFLSPSSLKLREDGENNKKELVSVFLSFVDHNIRCQQVELQNTAKKAKCNGEKHEKYVKIQKS
jgi:hypothetical protein